MFLLDVSGSHRFGTRVRFKRELLAEVAGMLAFLAIRTNDKVGAVLFSSRVEKYIPPKKGASHVWRLIKEIFTYEPKEPTTRVEAVLTYLNRVVKRHAIVFLLSDCIDAGFEEALRLTAKKHDLTILRIADPAEEVLPDVGIVSFRDPETGQVAMVDTSSRRLREKWQRERQRALRALTETAARAGVDVVELRTDGSVVEPLMRLFEKRKRHS
jgi:uncharacterized protein (DUF58 family)